MDLWEALHVVTPGHTAEFFSDSLISRNTEITNMDEGYDTDGGKGPFYESVDHKVELGINIEEKTLPPKKELGALVVCAENPVHDNDNAICHIVDGYINSNITDGDPGSFVFISDEDINKMKAKGLQEELKKYG
eukprot:15365966-Ditylum_brightwellii.AAC.2